MKIENGNEKNVEDMKRENGNDKTWLKHEKMEIKKKQVKM